MNMFFMEDESISEEKWQMANNFLERHISFDFWTDMIIPQQIIETQKSLSQACIVVEETAHSELTSVESIGAEKKKKVDYEKNICAYITKKVVTCLLSSSYKRIVERLCAKNQCLYSQIKSYYGEKIEQVFGITLLSVLITPQSKDEIKIKKVFRSFLKWFLRQKYMFYLLKYGKMEDKEKYVEFKNKYLLYIEQQNNLCFQ